MNKAILLIVAVLLMGCSVVPLKQGTCLTLGNTAVVFVDPSDGQVYYIRGGNQVLKEIAITRQADGAILIQIGNQESNSEAVQALVESLPEQIVTAITGM